MNNCRDCKHWEPRQWDRDGRSICLLTENEYDLNPDKSLDTPFTVPKHPKSLAIAYDGESYYAGLFVTADFGCVQWEPR
jgi:hypothetical protein